MATPYLVQRREEVPSTQDVARDSLGALPVLVIAAAQSAGRGRGGGQWLTAPRALAASVATRIAPTDSRPFSLIAGVAAVRALSAGVRLKWPNDVMTDEGKVGGILVERTDDVLVVGLGLNLWWPEPPEGAGALYPTDPGAGRHVELGSLWAAELFHLLDGEGWPQEEYVAACETLGREIAWEPRGRGRAVSVDVDGGLVVSQDGRMVTLTSGVVRHVRG